MTHVEATATDAATVARAARHRPRTTPVASA